jgi:hypothetical protein
LTALASRTFPTTPATPTTACPSPQPHIHTTLPTPPINPPKCADGAVGDGTQTPRTSPTLVSGGGEWSKISGGDWHASGTKADGGGFSWGYNGGRLGTGKTDPVQATTPQQLEGTWIEVSAGHFHGCGIKIDGTAWCWGNNRNGRMGTGTISDAGEMVYSPQPVKDSGAKWKSISAKGSHTCGLKEDNTAWCWGGNEDGELGLGTAGKDAYETTPKQIPGEWKMVQSGLRFSCAIDFEDALYWWVVMYHVIVPVYACISDNFCGMPTIFMDTYY